MAVGLTMTHRCDVERYTLTAEGHGSRRVPAAHLAGVHCRLKTDMQRGFNSITAQWVVSTRYRLLVPFDTDIAAGDRVTGVYDEYGDAVAGNWEVVGVVQHRGQFGRHKSLELNRVS